MGAVTHWTRPKMSVKGHCPFGAPGTGNRVVRRVSGRGVPPRGGWRWAGFRRSALVARLGGRRDSGRGNVSGTAPGATRATASGGRQPGRTGRRPSARTAVKPSGLPPKMPLRPAGNRRPARIPADRPGGFRSGPDGNVSTVGRAQRIRSGVHKGRPDSLRRNRRGTEEPASRRGGTPGFRRLRAVLPSSAAVCSSRPATGRSGWRGPRRNRRPRRAAAPGIGSPRSRRTTRRRPAADRSRTRP